MRNKARDGGNGIKAGNKEKTGEKAEKTVKAGGAAESAKSKKTTENRVIFPEKSKRRRKG